MVYGHAERNRIAAQVVIAETVELLRSLPSLDAEQFLFVQEFTPIGSASADRRLPAGAGFRNAVDTEIVPNSGSFRC